MVQTAPSVVPSAAATHAKVKAFLCGSSSALELPKLSKSDEDAVYVAAFNRLLIGIFSIGSDFLCVGHGWTDPDEAVMDNLRQPGILEVSALSSLTPAMLPKDRRCLWKVHVDKPVLTSKGATAEVACTPIKRQEFPEPFTVSFYGAMQFCRCSDFGDGDGWAVTGLQWDRQ
jgi:hypothetical protein